jgi:hypothetical protein
LKINLTRPARRNYSDDRIFQFLREPEGAEPEKVGMGGTGMGIQGDDNVC